jgi:DUF4097 and DUF4098 domain-containing protein YvlB
LEEAMTKMKIAAALMLSIVLLPAPAHAFGSCRHHAERSATIELEDATIVEVRAGAGSLEIQGADTTSVDASGTACASREGVLDDIDIEIRRSGDRVIVETVFPSWFSGNASLDLTVTVPRTVMLRVDDGSGEMQISNVAAVELEDGSGDLRISNVASAQITDGSGEIEVSDVAGDVSVSDGSGDIEIRTVGGSVELEDGSGEIDVRNVTGSVTVLDDGSGDMTIAEVGQSVRIRQDGSGDIRVRQVAGDLVVDDDGSGDIVVDEVSGRVDVPED